eukprot:365003-Chlamydomonas_euryale.AAC.6
MQNAMQAKTFEGMQNVTQVKTFEGMQNVMHAKTSEGNVSGQSGLCLQKPPWLIMGNNRHGGHVEGWDGISRLALGCMLAWMN